ncbi:hypothetical protein [Burkholderia sp. Ac-20379]|uniref:hypothetical protein n=1 Tax=Burkholderia sp. Ac-20379 TaxID=2703900 RepID=UPI00197E98F8|nr:hypothetical protein [Burkholderia sp. Ac-20379]MBN3727969.1 hypothetical protein [Burkholderia sp. Ac-20379]
MRDAWRANAMLAAVAAMSAQLIVLLLIGVFDLPDRAFTTAGFHCAALGYIAATMGLVHRLAARAFRAALASGHVCATSWAERRVRVAAHCPRRLLVLAHVRLHRYRLDCRAL